MYHKYYNIKDGGIMLPETLIIILTIIICTLAGMSILIEYILSKLIKKIIKKFKNKK